MNFARVAIRVAALSALLSGCGTAHNLVSITYHERPTDPHDDYEPPDYRYGGVKIDAWMIRQPFSRVDEPILGRAIGAALVPLWIADIPLSAACDTLMLPETIAATQQEAKWWHDASAWRDSPDGSYPGSVKAGVRNPDAKSESSSPTTEKSSATDGHR
jgi:uncharacterized protein YceK